jgi:hypothetical protein
MSAWIGTAVFSLAVIAWLVAAVSALEALRYRKPEHSALWFAWHGMAFFDRRNFLPEAAPYLRRLRWAFVAFLAIVIAGVATTFILIDQSKSA